MRHITLLALGAALLVLGAASASPGGGQAWVTGQDGSRIYIVHGVGAVEAIDLPWGTSPHFSRFSPSGEYVYVPSLGYGSVTVIRAQDRAVVRVLGTADGLPAATPPAVNSNPLLPGGLGAHDAKPSPDGSIVLVAHWKTNSLYKIEADEDAETWSMVQSQALPDGRRPICIVYHPSGERAYVGAVPTPASPPGTTPAVALVDVETLNVARLMPLVGAWSCSWAMTRDTRTLYLSTNAPAGPDGPGGRVYRLDMTSDPASDTLTLEFRTGSPHVHGLGMSEDETTLFATSRDEDELHIIDIATGTVEKLALDATPGLPDKPDTVAVRGDNVWVTLRGSGKLARVKGSQRRVEYVQIDSNLAPCSATETLCYAIHSVELGY